MRTIADEISATIACINLYCAYKIINKSRMHDKRASA